MQSESTVRYLSEFVVCQSQSCFQSISICHKSYFRQLHCDVVGGKLVTHKSTPFDESLQFANFYAIARLENKIADKLANALKGLPANTDTVLQTAIYTSQLFLEVFNNSTDAIGEYLYLRSIQKGQQMPLVYAFSQALCAGLLANQDRRVGKSYREVCRESPQWEQLNAEFNLASGINSVQLEQFIQREAAHFIAYCQKLSQSGKEFAINEYVALRNSSTAYESDPYYFGSEFTHFLTVKYERHPERQRLFDVAEYYLHFWEYFYVGISKNVSSYFEEEVTFYKNYETVMAEAGLRESFLSFRMWRLNHCVSTYKPSLRNPFFLESYIYSLIQDLIYKKLHFPEEKRNYDFRYFARHLKDYVKFVRDKNQQFSFARYRDYFDFRNKNEKFEQGLATNKDIIYDRNYFLEYAHNQFLEGNKLAGKKYRKFLQSRQQQEEEKAKAFRHAAETLKGALIDEEKQQFYEILFVNFLNATQEDHELPTREGYFAFKSQVLASVDETFLQEEESNYKLALSEQQQGQGEESALKEKEKGKKDDIVKEEINAIEEKIAEIIVDEDRSGSSSEEQSEEQVVCPCCKGNSFDCPEKECMIMGCCTTCMLD